MTSITVAALQLAFSDDIHANIAAVSDLVRDAAGLEHAASVLEQWRAQPRTPRAEAEFEDENLLLVATELVDGARARRASVGAHFRADDPAYRSQDARTSSTPNDHGAGLEKATILRTVHVAGVTAC